MFHLDGLISAIPLNADLDTTLTVMAGNLYRLSPHDLPGYENATRDRIWRLCSTPPVHPAHHRHRRHLRAEPAQPPPVLIDAGFADLATPISGGTPASALPLPTSMIKQETSTQLPDLESML